MTTYLCTFSNQKYYLSARRLLRSAKAHGVDRAYCFTRLWLLSQRSFYRKNRELLDAPRGSGYWLWKPYIIQRLLKRLSDNDVLIYSDAGISVTANLNGLVDICRKSQGVVLFQTHGQINRIWTKRDCFIRMGCDRPEYHNAEQVMGGFSLFKKTELSIHFVDEWLRYTQDRVVVSDAENSLGKANYPDFQAHRHDQSILTNLSVKYQIPIYRDPSQYGNRLLIPPSSVEEHETEPASAPPYESSRYPTLLNHHRNQNGRKEFYFHLPCYLFDTISCYLAGTDL